jgi:hypothetical protein
MRRKVLGIDVASSKWSSNGAATLEFDDTANAFTRVASGVISWPALPLTASALANAIDEFAKREGVCAVSLDGPQGWRDPATPPGTPGVGRRCEYECRTQGKTGVYPRTFPGNQRTWIEFSIAVFDELLAKPGVVLADPSIVATSAGSYVVLECFPTSAWRSSGLAPLPAKQKNPDLATYMKSLAAKYRLPSTPAAATHDDVQALVAALTATGAAAGPADAYPRGVAASRIRHHNGGSLRVEGYIWDVKPLGVLGRA